LTKYKNCANFWATLYMKPSDISEVTEKFHDFVTLSDMYRQISHRDVSMQI